MGNTQSSLENPDLSPSRLSKPKTVNPTNEGLLSLHSGGLSTRLNRQSAVLPARPEDAALETNPAPIMCLSANVSEGNSEEVKAKLGGRKGSLRLMQEKAARRMSLFRSKSSQGNPHKEKGASTVRPMSRNCTTATSPRSNSVTFESAAAAGYLQPPRQESWAHPPQTRPNWNYDTTIYASQRLINLAEEPALVHTTAVSERATTMTEHSWNGGDHFEYNGAPDRKHSWNGGDHFEYDGAPIRRADSDLSLYVPVRRRSILQTPGVATRRTSTRDGLTHSQSVRYSHPQTPQISRQQSIESFREGILSMPPPGLDPLALQRVVTPCEDEYQSIGAFKLGTLRITNGTASPLSPELEGEGQRVDYFSRVQSSIDSRTEASQFLQVKMPEPRVVKPANNVLAALSQNSTQPEYSSNEVLDVRLDPNAKSQPSTSPSSDVAATVARTDSGFMSIFDESLNSKPLAKADSGYSSNVSLRSLHTKSKIFDREKNKSDEIQISPVKVQDFGLDIPLSVSPPSMTPESEAPPSVPAKDTPPVSPLEGGQMFENLRKSLSLRGQQAKAGLLTPKSSQKSEKRPSLSGSSPKSPELNSLTPASTKSSKSDRSNSAHSISSTSQKPSRLQRFLSGARRPTSSLPTHSRHAPEEICVPAIPKDVEHEFRDHGRRFPMTARRLALKPRSSMDTLKTIFSVGSIEASLEATTAKPTVTTVPEAETGELAATKGVSWRKSIRKSMVRKPVRTSKDDVREGRQEEQPGVYDSILPPKSGKVYGSTVKSSAGSEALKEAEMAGSRLPCDRTMSLTVSLERTLNMQMVGAHSNLAGLPTELPTASLPSPVIFRTASMTFDHKTTHNQPPVSMQTRRSSLRVPQPHLRPQSSTSSLRHEVSREDVHSYPSVQSSRRPSRESIHSYPVHEQAAQNYSAHEELGTIGQDYLGTSAAPPQMDPRRLAAFRQRQNTLPPTYRVPDWNPPTRSDISRQSSMTSSNGTSHHNSSNGIQRPSSAQPRHSSYIQRAQTLRHRPSHDAYQQLRLQNANPPDMSSVYGVLANEHPSMDYRGTQGHVVPDSTYPSYVPRQTGHHRKRSMSMHTSHNPNPPYRILHSYNSPAYRNAPIWG
ncbi:hypothetical protein QR685DRAFT_104715 [Neurospora intermedia]|uniref:Proteophosphoglycan ppg4 n=1 Tax=Neurospora intermedia TaxID=5142 RepID=A0ABR3D1Y2_NEUIN